MTINNPLHPLPAESQNPRYRFPATHLRRISTSDAVRKFAILGFRVAGSTNRYKLSITRKIVGPWQQVADTENAVRWGLKSKDALIFNWSVTGVCPSKTLIGYSYEIALEAWPSSQSHPGLCGKRASSYPLLTFQITQIEIATRGHKDHFSGNQWGRRVDNGSSRSVWNFFKDRPSTARFNSQLHKSFVVRSSTKPRSKVRKP